MTQTEHAELRPLAPGVHSRYSRIYLICSCGAWNSKDHQVINACYLCKKKLLKTDDDIACDARAQRAAADGYARYA